MTARKPTAAFDVGLPALSADASGRIGLEPGWPFEARANLRKSQLTSLASLLGMMVQPDTSATLTASADVRGQLDRPFDSTGIITVPEIEGQSAGRPLRLIQPGRIRFDGRRPIVEEPLGITVGEFSMGLASIREREHGVLVTLEGRIEMDCFPPPDTLATPWRGRIGWAQVSLTGCGSIRHRRRRDATIDKLMRTKALAQASCSASGSS